MQTSEVTTISGSAIPLLPTTNPSMGHTSHLHDNPAYSPIEEAETLTKATDCKLDAAFPSFAYSLLLLYAFTDHVPATVKTVLDADIKQAEIYAIIVSFQPLYDGSAAISDLGAPRYLVAVMNEHCITNYLDP